MKKHSAEDGTVPVASRCWGLYNGLYGLRAAPRLWYDRHATDRLALVGIAKGLPVLGITQVQGASPLCD